MIPIVISWKFNDQPGMVCKEVDGEVQIVSFPGGVPSKEIQAQWVAEYQAWIASDGEKDRTVNASLNDPVIQTLIDAFHELDTRVRVLEGKQPVARAAIADWLRDQYRTHV